MSAIHITAQVPESRQVTITLPPDTPVGKAELEVIVRPSEPPVVFTVELPPDNRPKVFPTRPTPPELASEFDAFERMLPDLMKTHAGKYVALRGGVVVAAGRTKTDVLTAAGRQFPGELLYARLVTDQPQPIPRITSFREVRKVD